MKNLPKPFPKTWSTPLSTIRRSSSSNRFEAVIHTLFEAVTLVLIVVLVFLQTWRATIIPLLAVPVFPDWHLCGVGGVWFLAQ